MTNIIIILVSELTILVGSFIVGFYIGADRIAKELKAMPKSVRDSKLKRY